LEKKKNRMKGRGVAGEHGGRRRKRWSRPHNRGVEFVLGGEERGQVERFVEY